MPMPPFFQFAATIPHIIYAALGGFVVFVSILKCHSPAKSIFFVLTTAFFKFGMFSLFIREKVSCPVFAPAWFCLN